MLLEAELVEVLIRVCLQDAVGSRAGLAVHSYLAVDKINAQLLATR